MPQIQTFGFQGCHLAYRISGKGPPLVMIQGVGAYGATGWNPQVDLLEKDYTCLSLDNRGMGASQPATAALTVDQMAADTIALMDHAGWPSAHIVGHSLGGLIALQTALRDKTRVRSLVPLCSFARGADATRMNPAMLWIMLRLQFGSRRTRQRAFMELLVPPDLRGPDPDAIARTFSRVLGHDILDMPPTVYRQLKAMRRHNVTPRLRELTGIPTLVITGAEDPIAPPRSGRAIAAGIGGARYIEIPGASHSFPVLEAKRCAALILDHLATAERQT